MITPAQGTKKEASIAVGEGFLLLVLVPFFLLLLQMLFFCIDRLTPPRHHCALVKVQLKWNSLWHGSGD